MRRTAWNYTGGFGGGYGLYSSGNGYGDGLGPGYVGDADLDEIDEWIDVALYGVTQEYEDDN